MNNQVFQSTQNNAGRDGQAPTMRIGKKAALWGIVLACILLLPLVFTKSSVIGTASMMGVAIVFALSYNMLLGQTGLLSFGHAVYFGLGGFFAAQWLVKVSEGQLPVPLILLPLAGGAVGLAFGIFFGWISTKRGGTVFAMITLGLAELVAAIAALMTGFFGGEQGVMVDRGDAYPLLGVRFLSSAEVYYLIAGWALLCGGAMYYLTRTPFGRLCNAVRDNPMRIAFVGYSPRWVRFMAFAFSGCFAGVAGALSVINFEMATSTMLGAQQSAAVLLMTFIGGVGNFAGPIFGAILVTWLQISLSDITPAWQLYLGLLFVLVVMYLPGGMAQLWQLHCEIARAGLLRRLLRPYLTALVPLAAMLASIWLGIELAYRLTIEASRGPLFSVGALTFHAQSLVTWGVLLVILVAGAWGWRRLKPSVTQEIDATVAESRTRDTI